MFKLAVARTPCAAVFSFNWSVVILCAAINPVDCTMDEFNWI